MRENTIKFCEIPYCRSIIEFSGRPGDKQMIWFARIVEFLWQAVWVSMESDDLGGWRENLLIVCCMRLYNVKILIIKNYKLLNV